MEKYGVGVKEAEKMGYIPLCTVDHTQMVLEFLEKQIYRQYKTILNHMENLKVEGDEFYLHFLVYMEHNNYFTELDQYYGYECDEYYKALRNWCKSNRIPYYEK